jgi:hypothetical protein
MVTIDYTIKNDNTFGCLFAPDGKYIGEIKNEYQLYDVQIQIVKEKTKGYYIVWKEHTLTFDEKGQLDKWPDGYYDRLQHAFAELHKERMGEKAPEVFVNMSKKDWRHNPQ